MKLLVAFLGLFFINVVVLAENSSILLIESVDTETSRKFISQGYVGKYENVFFVISSASSLLAKRALSFNAIIKNKRYPLQVIIKNPFKDIVIFEFLKLPSSFDALELKAPSYDVLSGLESAVGFSFFEDSKRAVGTELYFLSKYFEKSLLSGIRYVYELTLKEYVDIDQRPVVAIGTIDYSSFQMPIKLIGAPLIDSKSNVFLGVLSNQITVRTEQESEGEYGYTLCIVAVPAKEIISEIRSYYYKHRESSSSNPKDLLIFEQNIDTITYHSITYSLAALSIKNGKHSYLKLPLNNRKYEYIAGDSKVFSRELSIFLNTLNLDIKSDEKKELVEKIQASMIANTQALSFEEPISGSSGDASFALGVYMQYIPGEEKNYDTVGEEKIISTFKRKPNKKYFVEYMTINKSIQDGFSVKSVPILTIPITSLRQFFKLLHSQYAPEMNTVVEN